MTNLSSTILLWRAHILYQFASDRALQPFAVVGGGFASVRKSAPDLHNDTDFAAYLGGGLNYRVTDRWSIRAGGRALFPPSSSGSSVTIDFEVLIGLHKSFGKRSLPDPDGDGIVGAADKCPHRAETVNQYQDEDGCPDQLPDYDNDGIRGDADECPHAPETFNGYQDSDGCPDMRDTDNDGIGDEQDKCPNKAEDKDGFQDADGCPDLDNDGDGIPDAKDKCPNEPEDKDGFQDADGSPDLDNDGDGIPDAKDKCPNEKEIFNSVEDEDGCPETGKAIVVVAADEIDLTHKIQFGKKDAILTELSQKHLMVLVNALKAHSKMRVRIEVHTDDEGGSKANLALSRRRADSILAVLVLNGISATRLRTKGYGQSKPLVAGETAQTRAKNRRVELKIIGNK